MDKLELKDINKTYIENFLKYNEENLALNKEKIRNVALVNIALFCVSIFLNEKKLISIIILGIISVGIIISLVYFWKRFQYTKKYFYLFFGSYLYCLSLSISCLGFSLLQRNLGKNSYWFILGFMIIHILITCKTFNKYKSKIAVDYFKNEVKFNVSRRTIAGAVAGVSGGGLFKILEVEDWVVGLFIMIVALVFTESIYIVMKYQCYCILENYKIND